jgi:putative phosphotransacetylase
MENKEIMVPIEISARHIHLCREDVETLFGKNHELKSVKKLSQATDFASEETVDIEYNEHEFKGIRVVGPEREKTQLELTYSDTYKLKADVPIRLSGDIDKTPGFRIIGPAGVVIKKEGMIIAKRHLHVSPEEAEKYGIKNNDSVSVICGDQRKVTFHEVPARVVKGFKLSVHIDVDEANAAGLKSCGVGKLLVSE